MSFFSRFDRMKSARLTSVAGLVSKTCSLLVIAGICLVAVESSAQVSSVIVKVEEDWELQVHDSSPEMSAPQVVTSMAPDTHRPGDFFLFTMNYAQFPEFRPGGMQVQCYSYDSLETYSSPSFHDSLEAGEETIRWTQRLELAGGFLVFGIVDGQGRSYGKFGVADGLSLVLPSSESSLTSYRYQDSLYGAEIPFASNRVARYTLKEVRYYYADGRVHVEQLDQVVHGD